MIRLNSKNITLSNNVELIYEESTKLKGFEESVQHVFKGEFLQTCYIPQNGDKGTLLIGLGKEKEISSHKVKEAFAKASKEMKARKIVQFSVDLSQLVDGMGIRIIREATEGSMLGLYEFVPYKDDKKDSKFEIYFNGVVDLEGQKYLEEGRNLGEGVIFARNMVNTPGNKLRPMDFAKEIKKLMEDTDVEVEHLVYGQIKTLGMSGLVSVGESSEFPPCFMIIRYTGDPGNSDITGLVGKGVTCDTGGYCLKPANSMLGIKGDMAGGAAVAGAIYSLAKNKIKTNVVGLIPMCENRISRGSLLPGDVISSMAGKTIEIVNTDAEGRLILADAVTYAVQKEKVTRVLDIATLTGAVVNMLGFSIAGVLTDNQEFWEDFRKSYEKSGERYWRLPFYPEHEKMIKSKIADIKNQGESHSGTITAGLFIRSFAEGRPWLHIDIAGTAWVDTPIFEYQSKGATGAGVTSIYHLGCIGG